MTAALAEAMCLDAALRGAVTQAAALHDIGKLTLPARLWTSSGPLQHDDRCLARRHPLRGHAVLRDFQPPVGQLVEDAALTHHEAWDGSGYPGGLRGMQIPLVGRMVGLCDVYSALRERRPYKKSLSHAEAVAVITASDTSLRAHCGMFDPDLLSAFLAAGPLVAAAFDSAGATEDRPLRNLMEAAMRKWTRAATSQFGSPP